MAATHHAHPQKEICYLFDQLTIALLRCGMQEKKRRRGRSRQRHYGAYRHVFDGNILASLFAEGGAVILCSARPAGCAPRRSRKVRNGAATRRVASCVVIV